MDFEGTLNVVHTTVAPPVSGPYKASRALQYLAGALGGPEETLHVMARVWRHLPASWLIAPLCPVS